MKTLGADYAEETLAARIAGRPSPSRQPKQRTGKPSLLIDIQNNIKAQQSAGYKHWATIENLKRAAETLNFLTEHGIGSLEDLSERCDGAAARELKRLDAVPLPTTKRLRAEMDELTARRTALQSEYRKAQREEKEYDAVRQNVASLLKQPVKKKHKKWNSNNQKTTSGNSATELKKTAQISGYISLVQIAIILNMSYNLSYSDTTLVKNEEF